MEEYVCTLNDRDLKKAADEINEDPRERMSAVETLRKWCMEQPHITAPTDTRYLLKFLRYGKFSQLKARQTLQNFLKFKTETPEWFENIDMASDGIQAFLRTGYSMKLPTQDGQCVMMYRLGVLDPDSKLYTKLDILKAIFGMSMHIGNNESTMVNGLAFLMDFTGFEFRHQTFWGMDTLTKSTQVWQGTMPGRFKAFHYYNTGPVFEAMMAIIRPILSKKFQDRINMHGSNMESIYKVFPMVMLPREYLPDDYTGPNAGNIETLTNQLAEEMKSPEVRNRLLYETDPKWRIDVSKQITDVPQASFRKLNVE